MGSYLLGYVEACGVISSIAKVTVFPRIKKSNDIAEVAKWERWLITTGANFI
jgi:hypothetical protein